MQQGGSWGEADGYVTLAGWHQLAATHTYTLSYYTNLPGLNSHRTDCHPRTGGTDTAKSGWFIEMALITQMFVPPNFTQA